MPGDAARRMLRWCSCPDVYLRRVSFGECVGYARFSRVRFDLGALKPRSIVCVSPSVRPATQERCQLSPSHVAGWPSRKKQTIESVVKIMAGKPAQTILIGASQPGGSFFNCGSKQHTAFWTLYQSHVLKGEIERRIGGVVAVRSRSVTFRTMQAQGIVHHMTGGNSWRKAARCRIDVSWLFGRAPATDTGEGQNGGWGGIRTHGTLSRTLVFKTSAFNRSATHPVRTHGARVQGGCLSCSWTAVKPKRRSVGPA